MPWTLFWDMHSGGDLKEDWAKIYIEAPKEEAKLIFYNRFGHNPERVTCTCCGEDYAIDESESLEEASAFHRGCEYGYFDPQGNEVSRAQALLEPPRFWLKPGYTSRYVERQRREFKWARYLTLEQYIQEDDVLIIRKEDIKPAEREGTIPTQGYVWVG